jgi:hypothetical protein
MRESIGKTDYNPAAAVVGSKNMKLPSVRVKEP